MHLRPYVFFNGCCEEAFEFYRQTVGAEKTMLMRFKDSPMGGSPGNENKIMHMQFKVGDTVVLASDGRCDGNPKFEGFALTINVNDDSEAERLFQALSEGGKVTMPLEKTFFASKFGMLSDRFGVHWMILAGAE